MGIFGWDYPAGAENDPRAPWNQDDDDGCEDCGLLPDDCDCDEDIDRYEPPLDEVETSPHHRERDALPDSEMPGDDVGDAIERSDWGSGVGGT